MSNPHEIGYRISEHGREVLNRREVLKNNGKFFKCDKCKTICWHQLGLQNWMPGGELAE